MSVIDKLNQMHRDAVEQIRAGQDNEFLVGFLTTATMLELSNLIVNDFDLEQYAQAVVDVITQYAPIDRCRVQMDLRGFSSVVAASGALPKRALPAGMEPGHSTTGILRVDGVTSGTLIAEDVPAPLIAADFLQVAADQVASGLGKITERENEIRRQAVQRVIDLIDALDERWGPDELDAITRSLVSLPTVSGATISAYVDRLGGKVTSNAGEPDVALAEREFRIDNRVDITLTVHYSVEPWSTQHGQLDQVVAALAASLSRIEQSIRLTIEAETDQLTGLWNRRRVSRDLVAARHALDRGSPSFAVVLFDLDHFKQVNDRYGHLVGDAVLITFAHLLQRCVRPGDTAARWGGEEFVLVLPGRTEREAATLVSAIIEACSEVCAPAFPDEVHQTVSAGIAASADFPKASNEGLVKAADTALYQAKHEGRNRFAGASGQMYV